MSETMWRWQEVDDHIREVLPVNDSREHWLLDECWCNPDYEVLPQNIECDDGFVRSLIMYSHHAADGRQSLKETIRETH